MGIEAYKSKIDRFVKGIPGAVRKALIGGAKLVHREVIRNLSGAVLHRRSGKLIAAVGTEVKTMPLSAKVFVDNKQKYKAITHEEGRVITAKNPDGYLFTGKAKIKSVTIPKRPFMKPALEKKQKQAIRMILKGIMRSYKAYGR